MAARHAVGLANIVEPKETTGIVESIRQLRVTRHSAVKSRSAATVQLGGLIVTAPSGPREQLATRRSIKGQATLCRRMRADGDLLADPSTAAKLALHSLARHIAPLDEEIAELGAGLQPVNRDVRAAHRLAARDLYRARRPAARPRRAEHRSSAR